ncbi:SMI1-KNR4 cell-wall [Bacillus sp. OV322]|uniref:SMI1/KNR4 family protein n=1 Tax=Bacillus sp. OV322 TaxID=1882764 RepID=UPI0008EE712A|nr:SMI1/KNR4 family protein [Bacillus sp. OV322]SFC86352.1 SMI1-KNR4 cell-wall [Bacillus sp. OV322]
MRNIWEDLEVDFYRLKKLDGNDLDKAEKFFGVKFPDEYKELLSLQNGGYLKFPALPVNFTTDSVRDFVFIEYLNGVKENHGIYESTETLKDWGITEENLIALSGDGHSWIVLDYRKSSDNPVITYIEVEEERMEVIANSFKEMIEKLFYPA